MIPKLSELLVLQSKYDAMQTEKNLWRQKRLTARDYYNGKTNQYTRKYFSIDLPEKVPVANVNVTKRVIDRVSLVYMKPPKRVYTNDNIPELLLHKDFKLQRAERYTNLLDQILLKACWRNGRVEYDIIVDYEPQFGNDPLRPIGFHYPIATKSSVLS